MLDLATRFLLVNTQAGAELRRREEAMDETDLSGRAMHVASLGMNVLMMVANAAFPDADSARVMDMVTVER